MFGLITAFPISYSNLASYPSGAYIVVSDRYGKLRPRGGAYFEPFVSRDFHHTIVEAVRRFVPIQRVVPSQAETNFETL